LNCYANHYALKFPLISRGVWQYFFQQTQKPCLEIPDLYEFSATILSMPYVQILKYPTTTSDRRKDWWLQQSPASSKKGAQVLFIAVTEWLVAVLGKF
jgi:hypothetical protein